MPQVTKNIHYCKIPTLSFSTPAHGNSRYCPNLDLVMPLPRQTACRANALQKKRPLDLDENSRMRKIKTVSLLKKFL